MIWLPGVLSQGGDKYTWGRYTLKKVVTVGRTGTNGISNDGYTTSYGTGYTFDENTGKFTITGAESGYISEYEVGSVTYHDSSSNNRDDMLGTKTYTTIYEWTITNVTSSQITWSYKALTAGQGKGTLVDTVEASDPSAYPDNGQQGDYWYVRYADEPISWERYAMTEAEIQGESVTQSFTSSTYLYRATSYGRNGKTFTATGTRTRASSLAVGNYLIQNNGAFVNSTSMSGDTLFKITSKSGYSSVSITFATYTIGDVKGSYIDTVTSYNPYEYPDDGIQDGYWYVRVESGGATSGVNYVEYIESTGTQYIDTGFKPNQNTRVVMDAQYTSVPTRSACLFGARKASGSIDFSLWYVPGSSVLQSGYANTKPTATISDITARHVYDKNKNTLYLDGSSFVSSTASTFQSDYNLFLFESDQSGAAQGYGSSVKHWSCKIYDNGVLIRDYRPCIDPDGVVCVYDEVNKEYVYNAGTGVFIAGDPIGGDVPEEGVFSFTIDNETFYADAGMTWAEWVNSAYNTVGAYIFNSSFVFHSNNEFVLVKTSDYEYVPVNDAVLATAYSWITAA